MSVSTARLSLPFHQNPYQSQYHLNVIIIICYSRDAQLLGSLATSGSTIKPQCTPNNNAALPPGDINPHHQHYHYLIMAVDAFWIKKRQIWSFFAANSYIWIQIELMICKDSCGTSKLIDFAVDPIMQLWLWESYNESSWRDLSVLVNEKLVLYKHN